MENEEIDIHEIVKYVWSKKNVISIITLLFAISSIFYSLNLPNVYRSTVVLSPADNSGNTIAGSMSTQIGGIASLAGISLGANESSESLAALEIMQSWSFIDSFISNNNLMVKLEAAKNWDKQANKLVIDNNIYNIESRQWINGAPTSFQLYENLIGRMEVIKNIETKMIKVSMDHFSPIIAKELLVLYIKAINDHMRLRKLEESELNIGFLEAQLKKTSLREMKEILFSLIETETKNIMLAEARPEYAFSTVSEAMIAEEKNSPTRSRIVILATFFGGLSTTLFYMIIYTLKRKNEKYNS